MRIRWQELDWHDDRRGQYRVCVQAAPGDNWTCVTVSLAAAVKELQRLGVDDFRDQYELRQQASAATREWGLRGGYAEFDSEAGVRRSKARPTPLDCLFAKDCAGGDGRPRSS